MFKKVLFPTDFSSGSEMAAKKFEEKNSMNVEELILLYVVDESILEELSNGFSLLYNSEEEELSDIEKRLSKEALAKLEREAGMFKKMFKASVVKTVVQFGMPYVKIDEVAEKENVSLIIMPSHGKMGFSKEFLGSTTIRLLKRTNKPMLIVKTREA